MADWWDQLRPDEREMWERLEGGKERGCGTLWYGEDMERVLCTVAHLRALVAILEEGK